MTLFQTMIKWTIWALVRIESFIAQWEMGESIYGASENSSDMNESIIV